MTYDDVVRNLIKERDSMMEILQNNVVQVIKPTNKEDTIGFPDRPPHDRESEEDNESLESTPSWEDFDISEDPTEESESEDVDHGQEQENTQNQTLFI